MTGLNGAVRARVEPPESPGGGGCLPVLWQRRAGTLLSHYTNQTPARSTHPMPGRLDPCREPCVDSLVGSVSHDPCLRLP